MTKVLLQLKALLAALFRFEIKRQKGKAIAATMLNIASNRRRDESIKDAVQAKRDEIKRANSTFGRKINGIHDFEDTQREVNNKKANKACAALAQLEK